MPYLNIKLSVAPSAETSRLLAAALAELTAEGRLHPASYVVIHEVSADDWGYQGCTQEFRFVFGKLP